MTGRLFMAAKQPASSRLFAFCGVSRQRGFTLIELMVVLVIVGVILTFVALSAGGDSNRFQIAGRIGVIDYEIQAGNCVFVTR